MKGIFFLLVLTGVSIVSSQETEEYCDDSSSDGDGELTQCPDNLEELLVQANSNLTGLFLYNSMKRKPGENLIMSAFSLFTPFGQLAYFSQGNTLRQFLDVLNLSSKEYIECVFPPLLQRLSSESNVILNLAARLFASASYPLSQEFLEYTNRVFDAVAENLDFNDGEAAAKRINQWAANETNNRIKDIANPQMFSGDTRVVLANAIYFLGNWERQFIEDNTMDRDFHISNDKTVKIPTMFQQSTFKYGESSSLNAQFLELFYKGGNFSFFIILPNEVEGLETVVEKMQAPAAFYDAYDNTRFEKVQLYLPKFKVESDIDLSDVMQEAGLTDVFSLATSNLTGILESPERLAISSAKQKAFCLVNEKGTEAAAVNIITVGTTSAVLNPPKIYTFDCDRPIAFYIMYGRLPIFSGILVKPTEGPIE